MKKLIIISSILLPILLSGCSTDNLNNIEIPEVGENFMFYKSATKAEKTSNERSTDISDPFEIKKLWLTEMDERKFLNIEVNQIQGCEEAYHEKFEVIWNGMIAMIYPQQIVLYLKFNKDGCPDLQENVLETITLDLYKLIGNKEFVDASNFMVINASLSSSENDIEVIQHSPSD